MADRIVRTIFKYEVDQASSKAVQDTTQAISGTIEEVSSDLRSMASVGASSSSQLVRSLSNIDAQVNKVIDDTQQASSELDKLGRKTSTPKIKVEREGGDSNRVTSSGDRAIGITAQVLSGVGLGGVGEGLRLIKDFDELRKILPKVKESVEGVTSGIEFAGSAATSLIPALGGVSVGFGTILAVAAPVAIVVAAAAVAVGNFVKGIQESQKFLSDALAAQTNYYKAVEDLTSAQVKEEIEQKTRQNQILSQQLNETTGAIEAARAQGLPDALIGDLLKRQEELKSAVDINEQTITRFTQGLEINAFAENDAKAASEERAKVIQQLADEEAKLADLENQRSKVVADAAEEQEQIAQERRIRDKREQEDYDNQREKSLVAHNDRLAQIDSDGQNRLVAIRSQGSEKIAQADKEINKLTQSLVKLADDTNKAISKINSDYMKSEIKAFDDYRKEEEKATSEYNKQRARILKDVGNQLLDAERNNDIVAFIAAKERGQQQLDQQKEDFDDASKQRKADFDEARKLAEEERQQRLADLQEQAAQRRADIQQQIAERQAAKEETIKQINDELEAEKQAIKDRRAAEIKAYQDQQKDEDDARALRLRRQKEDDDREDKKRLDSLNKELADIDRKIRAEQEGIAEIIRSHGAASQTIGNFLTTVVGSALRNLQAIASSFSSSSSSYKSGGGGGKKPTSFADGGIADTPTPGLFGDVPPGMAEAIVPFKKSEGLGAALARYGGSSAPMSINFNAPITIGDGVSNAVFQQEMKNFSIAVIEGVRVARKS